jgi:hypothetical protein
MTTHLLAYSQMLQSTLAVTTGRFQNWIDGLLKAETVPSDQPQKSGLPVWAIVLIAIGVVVCLIPLCVFFILILLGPSISNVFSNIIEEI